VLRPTATRRAAAAPPKEWEAVLARAEAPTQGSGERGIDTSGFSNRGSGGGGGSLIRTARGLKLVSSPGVYGEGSSSGSNSNSAEAAVNASLSKKLGASLAHQEQFLPRSTFEAAEQFDRHAGGVVLASRLRCEAAGQRPHTCASHICTDVCSPAGHQQWLPFEEWLVGGGGSNGSGRVGVGGRRGQGAAGTALASRLDHHHHTQQQPASTASRIAAQLPHTLVSLESSLQRLRSSVKSEAERRPPFLTNFHPLLPGDKDRFQSLGLPLDLRGAGIHQR